MNVSFFSDDAFEIACYRVYCNECGMLGEFYNQVDAESLCDDHDEDTDHAVSVVNVTRFMMDNPSFMVSVKVSNGQIVGGV